MKNSFLSKAELESMGFKHLGNNILISRRASFYSPNTIEIGDNVRIDDFCILSGKIKLGSHIHISAHVSLFGKYGIEMKDYTGISPYSVVYSATDDFSGNFLIGPIHSENLTNVTGGEVVLDKFCQLGSHTIVMPGVKILEGSVTGAMTLVNKDLEKWGTYIGIPAKRLSNRSKSIKEKLNIIK